ncbi:unnamed protein product [Soboliphyme baturini]|uniref:Coatomer subunit epsilon-1-like n=1 Tax=Soboliphyme baturini TaxID=241478 RepID=A0A183I9F2_9BILA|nr:unnamed protein product [Soboliphyme baturini]
MGSLLKPANLLPILFRCEDATVQAGEVVRYLEFSVNTLNCTDHAVHNYLASLYAKYFPERLLDYLEKQGTDLTDICFDPSYVLRLCKEKSLFRACVYIYTILGLWEEAVNLALLVSVNVQ